MKYLFPFWWIGDIDWRQAYNNRKVKYPIYPWCMCYCLGDALGDCKWFHGRCDETSPEKCSVKRRIKKKQEKINSIILGLTHLEVDINKMNKFAVEFGQYVIPQKQIIDHVNRIIQYVKEKNPNV